MAKPKVDWSDPDNLKKLQTLPTAELAELYGLSKDTIRRTRNKWKLRLRKATTMEKTPEHMTDTDRERAAIAKDIESEIREEYGIPDSMSVGFHVGYIKNSDGEIEYTKPLINVRPNNRAQEFPQATPARITPSRRKPATREYDVIFAFSDLQVDYRRIDDQLIPLHDERAMRVARLICNDLQPNLIVNLGDTVDLAALARFKPDSDHFSQTLAPAFQRVHDYYAELRSDNPRARIIEVDSNHNTRLRDYVLKNAPALYNIKQAGAEQDDYPVMTYPYLTNLRAVNVDWISGYGAAEYVHGEEYGKAPIVFKHGVTVASGGSTAAKESAQNPETHVVRGHGHRAEQHTRTMRDGTVLHAIQLGALCRNDGIVPSYHSAVDDHNQPVKKQENWNQSVLVIEDYKDGHYTFTQIAILNGIARYRGKEYSVDENI